MGKTDYLHVIFRVASITGELGNTFAATCTQATHVYVCVSVYLHVCILYAAAAAKLL